MGKSRWMVAPLAMAVLATWYVAALAEERTLDEFKAYVQEKLPGELSEAELDQLAKMVDKNGDNVISDAEFETRMDAVQQVMAGGETEDAGPPNRTNRRAQMNKRMQARLESAGIAEGEPLPDATGLDIDGEPFELASLRGHYSVIVSGCLT